MTCSFSKEFSSQAYTSVENAFIRDYLPACSGNAVKVYLYGLYLCQNPKRDQSLQEMAKTLNLTEEEIIDCFSYFEEFGLCAVLSKEPFSVEYLPITSTVYSKPRKIRTEKYYEFTKALQIIIPKRMISTSEYTEYFNLMETYGIKPDAMLMIVKYCVSKKGEDIGYRYISAVAKDFGNREINTAEKVDRELNSYNLRNSEIEKILSALKLKRQADIEDQKLYKKWTQELNFEFDNVVFAASKLKKGGMEKLDAFIMELYSVKSFSKSEIQNYVDKKQEVYDLAIKINRALSVYVEVIDTEVETYINKWLSYGYEGETLTFIASHCFKNNVKTLAEMDSLIEKLRANGIIDLSSVGDKFNQDQKQNDFIAKILQNAGINRRPTEWDKENLAVWKSWNFTDDMILQAAKLSSGKSSSIAYMNGILSNWKNNGVWTVDQIDNATESTNSQEEYNREYESRRSKAMLIAQQNIDNAMAVEGFSETYSRFNAIEKDMAFAEIANNVDSLSALENEKKELTAKLKALLKTINLTIEDLSPRYRCVKCNDTGYIGDEKCDCYNKK